METTLTVPVLVEEAEVPPEEEPTPPNWGWLLVAGLAALALSDKGKRK